MTADGLFSWISCGSISYVSFFIWASGVEGDVVWRAATPIRKNTWNAARRKKGVFDVIFELLRHPFVKRKHMYFVFF